MVRKYFHGLKTTRKSKIAWRSHEPLRIEAFSDAVFGFTVSLLVFSLEVPKSSHDLLEGLWAFIPFIFCFTAIFLIWYEQYKFFRQYGLHDTITTVLNGALLVLVLFYAYPLKFMFNAWMLPEKYLVTGEDALHLIYVYVGGYITVYALFVLMYLNAYAKREELDLTPIEAFETRTFLYSNLALMLAGVIVVIAAIILNHIDVRLTFSCFIMFFSSGMSVGVIKSRRAKTFHRKFGSIPIGEPHRGADR